ncbi:coiled-coil domain-containing protein 86 [Latimeria chalumnae]|uniref:Coiled-coil domain-containing protein 86 n=1 Tax=Latimeria chalumnae TaxID=7897 RepID=H2ZVY6_LATCH|nr:PREDICTED: coiled-coil domain-containing protein 86 [Latimeria chalumnae]|eukprot:XP_006013633.1 PREDICTED: coiled-coil domain-containing protein 86 [Latimeria chalumnae]
MAETRSRAAGTQARGTPVGTRSRALAGGQPEPAAPSSGRAGSRRATRGQQEGREPESEARGEVDVGESGPGLTSRAARGKRATADREQGQDEGQSRIGREEGEESTAVAGGKSSDQRKVGRRGVQAKSADPPQTSDSSDGSQKKEAPSSRGIGNEEGDRGSRYGEENPEVKQEAQVDEERVKLQEDRGTREEAPAGKRKKGDDQEVKGSGSQQLSCAPRGRPKSGRMWKDPRQQRFSDLLRGKPLRTSWEMKMKEKRERQMTKALAKQLVEEKAREKEEKRKRQEENQRRRLENERKSEVVQVIKNPLKIKRMKKKQLRKIEKRDTLKALNRNQLEREKKKQAGGKLNNVAPAPAN